MGYAYEQYTATYLKRQRGQFFTNRLVIDFMVGMLAPTYEDTILVVAQKLKNDRVERLNGSTRVFNVYYCVCLSGDNFYQKSSCSRCVGSAAMP